MTLTPADVGHADGPDWLAGQAKVIALSTSAGVDSGTYPFVARYCQGPNSAWRLDFDSRNDAP
jgi:hypothetical protein